MTAPTASSRRGQNRALAGPIGAIVALALIAAVLLVLTEASTVASVNVEGESCEVINDASPELADRCSLSGWERHGGALILLALVAAGVSLGLATGRVQATTAAVLLLGLGAATLALALVGDLPVTNDTGAIGLDFDGATGSAGLGFYLELTGGALLLLAGVLALLSARREAASPAS